jgi:hypothetical protein
MLSDGIKISSNVMVLAVWYGTDVSLVVRELEINCEDEDADCGGERNVVVCEIDSVSWGTEFVVDWLNQRVRNFPWLLIVDDRLERSFPSTLTNSVSKTWKFEENSPMKNSKQTFA